MVEEMHLKEHRGIADRKYPGQLSVVDLFSGCGGIALGFQRAGFQIVGGIDLEPRAAQTFGTNFLNTQSTVSPDELSPVDIRHAGPRHFEQEMLAATGVDSVDVIVGGPPCQAFARIGRAKLRQIMELPDAHLNDGRADLYVNFLKYVEHFRPQAVLMENVPDILNFGGENVAEEIASSLDDMGYRAAYSILNSVHYGVPQTRSRMYLIAVRKDLQTDPEFPSPTHSYDLPVGYKRAHQVSLQLTLFDKMAGHYFPPPVVSEELPPAVSVQEAIEDLPPITRHLESRISGARTFDQLVVYRKGVKLSAFARAMREWSGFESRQGVVDHVIRYLPRDHEIFRQMKYDDQYPEAHAIATEMFQEELDRRIAEGHANMKEGSEVYKKLRARFVPPYATDKFPNKWRKLNPDKPAHTLTAHMGKDTYSHIHYDHEQARVISVREAARLQSFPDGFEFAGAMNAAYRQNGNAVPPLQAFALAKQIKQLLAPSVHQDARISDG